MENLITFKEILDLTGKKTHKVRNAITQMNLQPDKRISTTRLYSPEKVQAIVEYMKVKRHTKVCQKPQESL